MLRRLCPRGSSLFLQFDSQSRWLAAFDSDGLLDRSGIGLDRHELVSPGRHVGDAEFAVITGGRVVGIVHYVDPPLHPSMGVPVAAYGAGACQFRGNILPLTTQGTIEATT